MLSRAVELQCVFLVSHAARSSPNESLLPFRGLGAVRGLAVRTGRRLDQAGLEFHTETKAELLELVLDLVERFLAAVSVLEHLRLGFLRELTNGANVRIAQAI